VTKLPSSYGKQKRQVVGEPAFSIVFDGAATCRIRIRGGTLFHGARSISVLGCGSQYREFADWIRRRQVLDLLQYDEPVSSSWNHNGHWRDPRRWTGLKYSSAFLFSFSVLVGIKGD
jgi:hypothetical protein